MYRVERNALTDLLEVFDDNGALCSRLTRPANLMAETRIAPDVVRPYLRGALKMFDYHAEVLNRGLPVHSPWGAPHEVRALLEETLRNLGAHLETSPDEPGVVMVHANPGIYDLIARLIYGVAHLYDALARCGYYLLGNPYVIPRRLRRQIAVVPRALGGNGSLSVRRREARLYFRLQDRPVSGPRMEDTAQIDRILTALTDYGVPAPIYQLFATMIQGLARVGEQYLISLLDWYEPNAAFGAAISTTNKGSRRIRTKHQVIDSAQIANLHAYGNGERVAYDRSGRSLSDYEAIMLDGSLPLRRRREILAAEPLFPKSNGEFYSSTSGILDVHYRPAMKKAKLSTRSHYIRHAGVNDYFAYVDSLAIGAEDKREMKIAFGVHLGWAWPEVMLDWYSGPARHREMINNAAAWLSGRDARRHALAPVASPTTTTTTSDEDLSLLARVRALAVA